MVFFRFYFILTIIVFVTTILFYISRKKENKSYKFKYTILSFLVFLSIILFINPSLFLIFHGLEITESKIINASSILLLFTSILIFLYSLKIFEQDIIELEPPSRYKSGKGTIKMGRIMKKNRKNRNFSLSLQDLGRHMFVCGATGSGKSNFMQNFLVNFKKHHDIPFLLVEFKGEYVFLQDVIEDVLIIRPGENFSINIFNPEGSNPEIHAESLFEILKSGLVLEESAEFTPQMQKVLVDILTIVSKNPQYQSWKGFFQQCDKYFQAPKQKIPMLYQNLISIQNRIRRFSVGPLRKIFATRFKLNIKDIFDKNIIIDLSSIIRLGGEKEDALFFLNMVLKYLWDKNLTQGSYNFKGIKHVTIVEDAQYFTPSDLSSQTKLSSYLEDIVLLQRGTGECLISLATRPKVSEEILANCGVLIIFKN